MLEQNGLEKEFIMTTGIEQNEFQLYHDAFQNQCFNFAGRQLHMHRNLHPAILRQIRDRDRRS